MKAKLLSYSIIDNPPYPFSPPHIIGIVTVNGKNIPVYIEHRLQQTLKIGMQGQVIEKNISGRKLNFFIFHSKNKKAKKVAFVTGGARGIGKAIAEKLAKNGFIVIINSRALDKEGEETIEQIKKFNKASFFIKGDISEEYFVKLIKEKINKKFGKLDVLVNNAGIVRDSLFEKMTKNNWDEVIKTNLTSIFLTTNLLLPLLKESGTAKIINISSVVGEIGNVGQANYAASKSGIFGFTKSLAKELAPYGILVNTVAPGFIETRMTANIKNSLRKNIISKIPLARFGEVDDVAEAVLFLAKDTNRYITGEILNVNGGLS